MIKHCIKTLTVHDVFFRSQMLHSPQLPIQKNLGGFGGKPSVCFTDIFDSKSLYKILSATNHLQGYLFLLFTVSSFYPLQLLLVNI